METGAKKLDVGKIKISIAQKIMLLVFISSMITVVVSELSILPKVTSLYRDSICDNMKNLVKAYGSLVEYRLEKMVIPCCCRRNWTHFLKTYRLKV